ncbi:MAG: hypothetical protein HYZ14_05030 [Bacteroidetes bacterium]|nr:hypothetical protein [Bacteroidota bacterium]
MKNVWTVVCFTLLTGFVSCKKGPIEGCTDSAACNYSYNAEVDNGSCQYDSLSCGLYPYVPPSFSGEMYTSYAENWDDWDFQFKGVSGSLYTSYAENWDDWDFSIGGISGSISTSYAENWDDWNLVTSNFEISIYTSYAENWDDWDVDDDHSTWNASVYTSYSENWDDWEASGDSVDLDLYTSYSENWDDWDFEGEFANSIPLEHKVAVVFVPLIVTVLRQQGIIP